MSKARPLLAHVKPPPAPSREPLTGEEIDRHAKRNIQRLADKFARADEHFRRDLLVAMRCLGRGKRGAVGVKLSPAFYVALFEVGRDLMRQDGETPNDSEIARRLTTSRGPFHDTSPTALLSRLKRARARKK